MAEAAVGAGHRIPWHIKQKFDQDGPQAHSQTQSNLGPVLTDGQEGKQSKKSHGETQKYRNDHKYYSALMFPGSPQNSAV